MQSTGTALIDPKLIFAKIKLTTGMRVADFGCGRTGHLVFPSAQIVGEEGIVYAVDIVKNILQSIQSMSRDEGYNNIKTVWSDIELYGKTPIMGKSLNAVYFINVLCQLKNRQNAIKEAVRLLQKNGFLVIIDWVKKLSSLGPAPDKMISPEEITRWSGDLGARKFFQDQINDYNYCVIYRVL